MVFGPTLMLPTGSEELDLAAMNCTFTVIELICKHVRPFFLGKTLSFLTLLAVLSHTLSLSVEEYI